jgi:CRP/FNR family transcriptional regulator, nitrogen oxide reductase regulator
VIQDAEIFEGLSFAEQESVLNRGSLRALPKGAFLFRQGEPARKLFVLESGRVRLHEIVEDGRELLVRFVRPGEVFGDRAAIPGANYGASAESDTLVRFYEWTTDATLKLLEEIPRLARNLFSIATRYLRFSRERYRMLATSPAERRIHWAIRELARSFGSHQGDATSITGQHIQQDIADLGITTIYTVNRVLREYEQRGILTRKRGHIVLSPAFR